MSQFYVSTEDDKRRCDESRNARMPITITGYVSDDSYRSYTGVVQSVEDHGEGRGRYRWRITMRETQSGT